MANDKKLKPPAKKWQVPNNWRLLAKAADYKGLSGELDIDQVSVRVMINRGIDDIEKMRRFLNPSLEDMHDPALLPDAVKACGILRQKLSEGKRIRVIGDYDVDGITSTCILVKVLSFLHKDGKAGISAAIPDRISDGYGLSMRLIDEARSDGVDTIITCDNGIAAGREVEAAKGYGMTVIVTDHHEVPYLDKDDGTKEEILPAADAIVDPKRSDSLYPYFGICGAVVAFKLCMLLLSVSPSELHMLLEERAGSGLLSERGYDHDVASGLIDECIQLCAMATVCDVMELLDENRAIVKTGLKLMEKTKNFGLSALLNVKELTGKKLSVYHMGFLTGPCLNSSGRLESAMEGLELLLCEDYGRALKLAAKLNDLNDERKKMTEEGVAAAVADIEKKEPVTVIVAYLPMCHESLAGIVAGRLRERYERPVFVLTDAMEEGMLKGSGRSVEGYHMYENLHAVEDLLSKYGGHALAAGFSLPKENLAQFDRRLNENSPLKAGKLGRTTYIDADMPISYIRTNVVRDLERIEPFGQGNPKPVFGLLGLKVLGDVRVFGANRNVAKCVLEDEGGSRITAVYFGPADDFRQAVSGQRINILYYPAIDEYYGDVKMQLKITDYKVC